MVAITAVIAGAALGAWWAMRPSTAPKPAGAEAKKAHRARPLPTPASGSLSGTLEIRASAAGATVSVDGRELGTIPQEVPLRPGPHRVRVHKEGFSPFEREVHVLPGRTLEIEARLEAEGARLRVDSDVTGATVFLDRKPVGRTPVELRDVALGRHHLNVTAEGYEMHSEPIDVTGGVQQVKVSFKEVRLDAALSVVHKHGVGSCSGRLLATTAGLRYQTVEQKDAFDAAWSALEPLQVDYLKKNLRAKLRSGKTYNFTGESADELLTFQKTVEAARKRL